MSRSVALVFLAVTLATGCSAAGSPNPVASTAGEAGAEAAVSVATPGAAETPESTVGVAGSNVGIPKPLPGEPSPTPFVADARAGGGAGIQADAVLAVRRGTHGTDERLVLDLGAGDEPAETVPRWTLVSPRGDGLLRIDLPSVSVTSVTGGGLGDGPLKSFHVVRAPEGGMFVDVFAREAFLYRMLELEAPARLAVDFRPTGAPLKRRLPAAGGDTVLVEPRPDARISDPLTVSGYSRNFEAANTVILTDAKGDVLVRRTVTGTDWTSTWGYFEATMDLPPFSGKGTLRVGTRSARDGSFEGVEVPVRGG